uniref:Phospholipase-like protein n=1 Tax=Tanacetum cinerariifolium TaxID=118510 RepID=A0A6L2NTH3_TANCI|nr:phospholipase-like protein [Tanacetum cinerariifolium]
MSSEFERYVNYVFVTHLHPKEFATFDVLGFWKEKETMFPVLSRMTMDLISVQASSVASVSTFSTNFEEDVFDDEVQRNEAIPLSDEEIALYASSEGTLSPGGPRDGVKMKQFRALYIVIEGVLLHDMVDRWKWTLEGSGEFSVASARKFIDNSRISSKHKELLEGIYYAMWWQDYVCKVIIRRKLNYFWFIKKKLDVKRRILFRSTSFGPWLDLMLFDHEPLLIDYMLRRQHKVDEHHHDMPLIYYMEGHKLYFGRREFSLITGFHFGTVSFDLHSSGELKFRNKVFPNKIGFSITNLDIIGVIEDEDIFCNLGDDDAIRLCLLLALEVIFMGRLLTFNVDDALFSLVENLEAWNLFPWDRNYVPTYTLSGFVFAFQIWILETFERCESWWIKDPKVIPRALGWSKKSLFTRSDYPFLFAKESRSTSDIQPTIAEYQSSWWIDNNLYFQEFVPRAPPIKEHDGLFETYLSKLEKARKRRKTGFMVSSIGGNVVKCQYQVNSLYWRKWNPIGADPSEKKITWVAWNKVLASKKNGGLGVSSFFSLNRALLLKWVWRFISEDGSLWFCVIQAVYGPRIGSHSVHLPTNWSSIIREVQMLKSKEFDFMSLCSKRVGDGNHTIFWLDIWNEDTTLSVAFPRIFALEQDKQISVATKMVFPFFDSFRRPVRGGTEHQQLSALLSRMESVSLFASLDRWICKCSGDGSFSVKVWNAWFLAIRLSLNRKGLVEGVFSVAWWAIWVFRNRTLFDEKPPSRSAIIDDVVSLSFFRVKIDVNGVLIGRLGLNIPNLFRCNLFLDYLREEELRLCLEGEEKMRCEHQKLIVEENRIRLDE